MFYLENAPVERHPPRRIGDFVVIINKLTKMPEIGVLGTDGSSDKCIYLEGDGYWFKVSPYYWEVAWP